MQCAVATKANLPECLQPTSFLIGSQTSSIFCVLDKGVQNGKALNDLIRAAVKACRPQLEQGNETRERERAFLTSSRLNNGEAPFHL